MKDIKEKAREMLGTKLYNYGRLSDKQELSDAQEEIIEDIDQIIDLVRAERDKEIVEMIEKLKIRNNTKQYDGNNLDTACDVYRIAAISWSEIIRYEDGHDSALNEAINLITNTDK